MNLIIASILVMFLNKKQEGKILAFNLVLYLLVLEVIYYFKLPVFQDYLNIYTLLTVSLMTSLVVHTERVVTKIIFTTSIILPHTYYLLVLYKPYLLSSLIPIAWLFSVDTVLRYSILFITYEKANNLKFRGLCFEDYMLNVFIVLSLILF